MTALALYHTDENYCLKMLRFFFKNGNFRMRFAAITEFGFFAQLDRVSDMDIVLLQCCEKRNLEILEKTKKHFPEIKALLIANDDDFLLQFRAFDSGADGFALKTDSPGVIKQMLEKMLRGEKPISPVMQKKKFAFSDKAPNSEFTKTERYVLLHLCYGLSRKAIADKMDISPRTVDSHLTNMLSKTATPNAVALAVCALQKGIVIVREG